MRIRHLKLALLGALLVSVLAGTANAATWSTNGVVNFAATTGVTSFVDNATGTTLTCSGATASNGLTGVQNMKAMGTPLNLASLTLTCPGGAMITSIRVPVTCAAATLNGVTWAASGGTAPFYFGSITTGTITGFSCTLAIPGCASRVTGSVNAIYTNPTATVDGQLAILTTGQALTLSNAGGGSCAGLRLNNGDAFTFTTTTPPVLYWITSPATSASQPRIWNP